MIDEPRPEHGTSRIGAILDHLPPDHVVFHDVQVPGAASTIDHLVIGPTAVYVVADREFAHAVTLEHGTDRDSAAGSISAAGEPIDVLSLVADAGAVGTAIGARVRLLLCIVAPMLPAPAFEVDGVMVCHPNRLLTEVDRAFGRKVDVVQVSRRAIEALGTRPASHDDAALSELRDRLRRTGPPRPLFRLLMVGLLIVTGWLCYRVLSDIDVPSNGSRDEAFDADALVGPMVVDSTSVVDSTGDADGVVADH